MAYFRGSTYIWSDGERLHIWLEDGREDLSELEKYDDKPNAVGLELPESVADQFAVMRFAELLKLGVLDEVIDQAVGVGNFGSRALEELAPLLKGLARRTGET